MREPRFNGPEYSDADHPRLISQHIRVKNFMTPGYWFTLNEISKGTGSPPASVSAQLRHLRKERFGAYQVQRRLRQSPGLYEYKVLPSEPSGQLAMGY